MADPRGFARLARLYGLVEQQRSAELHLAVRAEQEAAAAYDAGAEAWREQMQHARTSVEEGNSAERLLAELAQQSHAAASPVLKSMQEAREQASAEAWQHYRASHIQTFQMRRAAERLTQAAAVEEQHRTQAASDDRFGSRREWMRKRAQAGVARAKGSRDTDGR